MDKPELHLILALIASLERYCFLQFVLQSVCTLQRPKSLHGKFPEN